MTLALTAIVGLLAIDSIRQSKTVLPRTYVSLSLCALGSIVLVTVMCSPKWLVSDS